MNRKVPFCLGAFLLLGMGMNAQEPDAMPNASIPPSITTQPASIAVKTGATATFKVVASGTTPLSYKWYGVGLGQIAGANSASYTTPPTTAADNGKGFYVTVSNTAGSVTSNTAYLSVMDPPVIFQQPQSIVITAPAIATFSVSVGGTYPMKLQWYKNAVAIPGATDYTYSVTESTTADNLAKFTVAISNAVGRVTSAPAILTIRPYTPVGNYPIVGEWSGTATITDPGGSVFKSKVVAAFTQTAYSLAATVVFVDDQGIPEWGAGIASLNSLNLFTSTDFLGTVSIAAGFADSTHLKLTGSAAASNGDGGLGTITISSDKKTLTGNGTASDGTKLSWVLTRIQ